MAHRTDEVSPYPDPRTEVYGWTARTMRPVVLAYVAGVFVAFMALSQFVFHSWSAVKALAAAAVGALVPMGPMALARVEYRLTGLGLERRPVRSGQDPPFKELFRWDELSHVVPTRTGFKFYKTLNEPRPLHRFWKLHVLERFSGEFHVEDRDRPSLEAILTRRGIPGPSRS